MKVQVQAAPGKVSLNALIPSEEANVFLKGLYTMREVQNVASDAEEAMCNRLIVQLKTVLGG